MNIGDKVRLLHGREEGVIVGFRDPNLVEVEIEDGFRIPALRSEVVVVSSEEAARFKKEEPTVQKGVEPRGSREVVSQIGVYLAFLPLNDVNLALYLVNNTDFDLPYTLGEVRNELYKGVQGGVLKRKTSVKVTELTTHNFEQWPQLVLQWLYFREGNQSLREPTTTRMRFRSNTFFKSRAKAPLLNKDAYLFQLDKESAPVDVKPEKILDSLEQKATPTAPKSQPVTPPPAEVDLHIEQLTPDHAGMSNNAILQLQLQTFEKSLENAVATGMGDITFIHGVGNGTLRNQIHRLLGRHPHVKFFEDARKEKFGYGATRVKLK